MNGVGMKEGYEMLINFIIRPPRAEYSVEELGPKVFTIGSKVVQRTDVTVKNKKTGLVLQCSHFEPTKGERPRKELPCVIYCHGNCGCRLDAQEAVRMLLPYDITVFCFDFAGSGHSEGEYVSLGWFEKDDLASVVTYLRETNTVSRIGLWGRSMGAATSLMFAPEDPSIACMVLDSPFASLDRLSSELIENQQLKVPKMLVKIGVRVLKGGIRKRANFDITKLEPIKFAPKCFIPALFAHGEEDDFILPQHSVDLMKVYPGDKNLIKVEGNHNSPRPQFFKDSVLFFLTAALLTPEERAKTKALTATATSGSTAGSASSESSFSYYEDDLERALAASLATTGSAEDEEAMLAQVLALSKLESETTEKEKEKPSLLMEEKEDD